jgi:nickel superoxide dismutase
MQTLRSIFHPRRTVSAHCDVPCGIYDPEQARIEAESCYRILEKYHASEDELFRQRCVVVKEARAEEAKRHIDVLWHDYFKPEHLTTYPDLHDTCWQASKAASTVKQTTDVDAARRLLDLIDQIEAMWRGTGGLEKTRMNGRPA